MIPGSLRDRVVELAHVGHQGIVKTKSLIRSRIWYPGIDKQVEERVKKCRECQANVDSKTFEPLRPSSMPAGPWQNVSGDFFGPMRDGNYWFVNYCEYSRWANVDMVKSVSMDQVEPKLEQLFGILGIPLEYKTDNGSPFQSGRFAEFSKRLGSKHRKITPYWPRANSGVESFMKKLGKVLKTAKISGTGKNEAVQEFLRVYRDTPHSSTQLAPNMLLLGYGRSCGLPKFEPSHPDMIQNAQLHQMAQLNDKKAKERNKVEFDDRMRALDCIIRVGEKVLFAREQTNKSISKWDPDPFVVTYMKGSLITAERGYPQSQVITRNSSFFKLFRSDLVEDVLAESHEASVIEVTSSPALVLLATAEPPLSSESLANQTVSDSIPLPVKNKVGRPTTDQTILMQVERAKRAEQAKLDNPPLRQSARLLEKGGKM